MDQAWKSLLLSASLFFILGLGGWFVVLAEADVAAALGARWGLLICFGVLGLLAGLATRSYQRYHGWIFPCLMIMVLVVGGWLLLRTMVWPGQGSRAGEVTGAVVIGYVIFGFRPPVGRWMRKQTWYLANREEKRRKRIASGERIVSGSEERCRLCRRAHPVEDFIREGQRMPDPWLQEHGDKLARCSHPTVTDHVYHVVHFVDNGWLCPRCNWPLFPDID